MTTLAERIRGLFAEGKDLEFELPEELQFRGYDRRIIDRLWGYVRPYARQMVLALALMGVLTATSLAGPYLIRLALDEAIVNNDMPMLRWIVLAFAGISLVGWLARSAQISLVAEAGQSSIYQVRRDLFARLQQQSMSFFDRADVGVLMSRLTSDVNALQELVTWAIVSTAADLFTLIGIVVVMVSMNLRLSLITFAVLPVMFLLTMMWRARARDNWRRVRFYHGRMLGYIEESIQGVRVVQAFSRELYNLKQMVEKINYRFNRAQTRAARLSAMFFPTVDVLGTAAVALAIGFGGSAVLGEQISPGVLVAFVLYIGRFFDPIRDLAERFNTLQAAMAAGERLFALLDRPIEVESKPAAPDLPPIEGEVRFEDVSFSYLPDVPVLQNIDLHVRPGQLIALVGATGSGKSTLVKLLNRSYDIKAGRLLIDGHDIRDVELSSLRRQMGIVLQETFLFRGSVADNIRYGRLDATDEEVIAAATAVGAHEFIESLPSGYDTEVEEGGAILSVGQRQLLASARALLADPRILILDEATSSIDTQTEKIIQEAMDRLLEGRTAFVIAHRLSTIVRADQIVVLRKGRIIEQGTHDELLALHGAYHHLYTMGFTINTLEAEPARA
jgi:ATP-binding cassette subfamily B protein/subfamily B ATP-binding cassette protein MsbA